MGTRFTEKDSIHLTRLGWDAIGMIAYDTLFRHELFDGQIDEVVKRLATIDWSRTNRDWIGMIGMAEQDKDGNPVQDAGGRERVVISGGKGDQGLKRAIAYLRRKVNTGKTSAPPVELVADTA